MAEVRVGENETFEAALRRFNKKIQQSGILAEARRREHYEKPSVRRKKKAVAARKRALLSLNSRSRSLARWLSPSSCLAKAVSLPDVGPCTETAAMCSRVATSSQ